MIPLNARQRTAAVVIGAAVLTLLAIHNPTSGYVTDHVETPSGGTYVWRNDNPTCTWQLRTELEAMERAYRGQPPDISAQLEHAADDRRRAIYRACMALEAGPMTIVDHPFLSWTSKGAMHPYVESVGAVLAGTFLLVLWGLVALYMLRTPKREN